MNEQKLTDLLTRGIIIATTLGRRDEQTGGTEKIVNAEYRGASLEYSYLETRNLRATGAAPHFSLGITNGRHGVFHAARNGESPREIIPTREGSWTAAFETDYLKAVEKLGYDPVDPAEPFKRAIRRARNL